MAQLRVEQILLFSYQMVFFALSAGNTSPYKLVSDVTIIWSIRIPTFFDAKSVPSPHFSPKVFGVIILFVISAAARPTSLVAPSKLPKRKKLASTGTPPLRPPRRRGSTWNRILNSRQTHKRGFSGKKTHSPAPRNVCSE